MLLSQDEMCNMYMMTYSELPVFMTCGNGQSWYQVDGPGGIPPGSSMAPESPAVWQPPPPAGAGADGELALGQIAGPTEWPQLHMCYYAVPAYYTSHVLLQATWSIS